MLTTCAGRHDDARLRSAEIQAMIPPTSTIEVKIVKGPNNTNDNIDSDRVPLEREVSLASRTSAILLLLVVASDVARSTSSYSMKHFNENVYPMDSTLVVTLTETLKALVVIAFHFYFDGANPFSHIDGRILIPCGLYAVTNNLYFWALHYVSPALWIVLTQMRIVFLLVIYRCALRHNVTLAQYVGAFVLMFGVALAQIDHIDDFRTIVGPALAIAAASSMMGAIAGIYTEIVLKKGGTAGVWRNQIHLYSGSAMISIVPNLISQFGMGRKAIDFRATSDVLTALVVGTVVLTAFNGICVSLVIKKLDNVARFQISAVTYIFTAAVNKLLFPEKFHLSVWYLISIVVILFSVVLLEKKQFNICSSASRARAERCHLCRRRTHAGNPVSASKKIL